MTRNTHTLQKKRIEDPPAGFRGANDHDLYELPFHGSEYRVDRL